MVGCVAGPLVPLMFAPAIGIRTRAGSIWRARWRALGALTVTGVALYFITPWLLGPIVPAQAVLRGALVQSIVASGRVATPHRVNIGSQITGTVASVPVAEGQAVALGQVLVTLEDGELRASVEQAEAAAAQAAARLRQIVEVTLPVAQENLSQAQSTLLNAQQQYARAESLRSGGFETQAQLDNVRRALNIAQAQVRAARAQVAGNAPGGTEYVAAEAALRQARASLLVALSLGSATRRSGRWKPGPSSPATSSAAGSCSRTRSSWCCRRSGRSRSWCRSTRRTSAHRHRPAGGRLGGCLS